MRVCIGARGLDPLFLDDRKVLSVEALGEEFLDVDTPQSGTLRLLARRHYDEERFCALREIHRTTFSRQAVNLLKVCL